MNEDKARALGLKPRARIVSQALVGAEPVLPPRRAGAVHRQGAREGRHEDRRHRPRRDQRGLRVRRAVLGAGARPRYGRGSTSTAARSRWVIRSAAPAADSSPPPCTNWSARDAQHRADHHVRGRRAGHRHHHRADLTARNPNCSVLSARLRKLTCANNSHLRLIRIRSIFEGRFDLPGSKVDPIMPSFARLTTNEGICHEPRLPIRCPRHRNLFAVGRKSD